MLVPNLQSNCQHLSAHQLISGCPCSRKSVQPVSFAPRESHCCQQRHLSTQQQHPPTFRCQALAQDSQSRREAESQPVPTSSAGRPDDGPDPLLTFAESQQIASARGLHISLKTIGPVYRIVCRDGGEEGPILGVTAGFVAPAFGLMHCDTLQVFTKGMKGAEGDRIRRNPLGLGLLLGGAVFSYGRQCGCRKAEILAINDDDAWHERLVRYYSYFGFKPVHKVGGRGFFTDLPHLLVWGGEGTRMDADIDAALARWTPALRQSGMGRSRSDSSSNSMSNCSSSSFTPTDS